MAGGADSGRPPLRLHLGAHKTATSYLQELLELNRGRIAANGAAFWPLEVVRPLIEYGLRTDDYIQNSPLKPLRSLLGRDTNHFLRDLAGLADLDCPVLISDENILGNARDCDTGHFYPNAARRLATIAALFPDRPIELWLSVRSYGPFLASIYAESLRHGERSRLEEFLANNANPAGRWPDLVQRLMRAVPGAKLVVWRYRDFTALEPMILRGMANLQAETIQRLPGGNVRPSPSWEAVIAMEHAVPGLSRQERTQLMMQLEEQHPRNKGTQFKPWPPEVLGRMDQNYEDDCRKLAELEGVTFLEPGTTVLATGTLG